MEQEEEGVPNRVPRSRPLCGKVRTSRYRKRNSSGKPIHLCALAIRRISQRGVHDWALKVAVITSVVARQQMTIWNIVRINSMRVPGQEDDTWKRRRMRM